jgi:hypothetical protein
MKARCQEWLQSPELRQRVQLGLKGMSFGKSTSLVAKGEAKNAGARAVFFNRLRELI